MEAAARQAVKVGHTRLPVCVPGRGLDAPLGLIHAQDLLEATLERPDVPLEELARLLRRVSEATLVTELVGEIDDEFDVEPRPPISHEAAQLTVAGPTPIRDLEAELGARLSTAHEHTIGGHVIELFGRLPVVGETIELNGYRVEVLELGDATIRALRIQPDHAAEPDG